MAPGAIALMSLRDIPRSGVGGVGAGRRGVGRCATSRGLAWVGFSAGPIALMWLGDNLRLMFRDVHGRNEASEGGEDRHFMRPTTAGFLDGGLTPPDDEPPGSGPAP